MSSQSRFFSALQRIGHTGDLDVNLKFSAIAGFLFLHLFKLLVPVGMFLYSLFTKKVLQRTGSILSCSFLLIKEDNAL